MAPITPRFIIHGGAGAISRSNLPPDLYLIYSASLLEINRSTASRLAAGASALDAATDAVANLEDNAWFNCGKGAVFTRDGRVELEASVMTTDGNGKRATAVALLRHVKNPIRLAREMLIRGDHDLRGPPNNGGSGDPSGGAGGAQGHCVLSGKPAEKLAEEWGLEMCEERYFWTRRRWEQHRRGLGKGKDGSGVVGDGEVDERDEEGFWGDERGWGGKEYLPQGTVGCVVLDAEGVICVATSTGGLTNKLSGRIGDTPTIGAGFWAEEWWTVDQRESVRGPRITRGVQDTSSSWRLEQTVANLLPSGLRDALRDCLPGSNGYRNVGDDDLDQKKSRSNSLRALAVSGTGNGDSFLRMAACRTAAAIARFSPYRTLTSATHQVAGPGGELQRSAGDRWGKTGEGEGGIIGIELRDGVGEVVADFNCGGMFRTWVDETGCEKVMVFKEEY
ncbi:MAG: hypothetical protein LQ338_007429 [Usnochroma carphineum]|nr:MAG: hypothetical protein LQ338_007429 [Usnochroma carphineum]